MKELFKKIPWGWLLVGFCVLMLIENFKAVALVSGIIGAILIAVWSWQKYIEYSELKKKEKRREEERQRQKEYFDDVLYRMSIILLEDDVDKITESEQVSTRMKEAIMWYYFSKSEPVIPARIISKALMNLSGYELEEEMERIEHLAREAFGQYAKSQTKKK